MGSGALALVGLLLVTNLWLRSEAPTQQAAAEAAKNEPQQALMMR
jgi:hypothetical protein